jgi:protein-arginine kinase activator protein McsA
LEWLCYTCKKEPATQICIAHGWGKENYFCDKCATKHAKECPDFEDYASLPVVNSPRMGVCVYMGGVIDKERDGVFVKKIMEE